MDCEEFLEDYSDFLDGQLEEHPGAEYRDHVRRCPSCAEYDRVMRRGLHLVRALDPPKSNADFFLRLQQRFFDRGTRDARMREHGRALAVASLALVGLLLVSLPVMQPGRGTLQLPPVVVEGPGVDRDLPSLWGPPPTFAPTASFLRVPDLTSDPIFANPRRPYSLFRTPLRGTGEPTESAEVAPE